MYIVNNVSHITNTQKTVDRIRFVLFFPLQLDIVPSNSTVVQKQGQQQTQRDQWHVLFLLFFVQQDIRLFVFSVGTHRV